MGYGAAGQAGDMGKDMWEGGWDEGALRIEKEGGGEEGQGIC